VPTSAQLYFSYFDLIKPRRWRR